MAETRLYSGTIQALTLDCTYEELLRIRLLDEQGWHHTITYYTTMSSQLTEKQVGLFLKEVREIQLSELQSPEHESVWQYFTPLDRGQPKDYLTKMSRRGYKLILHTDGQGEEYLVVCDRLKMTGKYR